MKVCLGAVGISFGSSWGIPEMSVSLQRGTKNREGIVGIRNLATPGPGPTCLSVGTGSAFVEEKAGCARERVGTCGREMTNACVKVLVCVSTGVCI